MSKRLFIALNASNPLADTFPAVQKKLRISADKKEVLIKWVPPENFHITVTFLGGRRDEEVQKIAAVLQEVCANFAPFDLKITDIGGFASETEARVLWLGVQNKRYLGEFKDALESALQVEGLSSAQAREFSPHLTIGRLRNPKSVKDMISPFKRKSFGKVQITEVVLYESKQQDFYSVYLPLVRCPLSGVPAAENEPTETPES